ncbi:MAG TPA: YfhO family protein [Chthonomonadaceae bacterium]|nr:YfhO family protein [Chthonomonadaceae bacterium]
MAPYLVLAFAALLLLRPLVAGRALYWGDILLYFEPMQQFARKELLAGRLPLWNPYIACGQPFTGNPQMDVFYPGTLLLFLLPAWLCISVNTIVHLYLCGAFMYLFIRRWTVRTAPAIAGALVYMGGAHLLGRLQFPPMVQTAAYFPLLFATLDWNVDRPCIRSWLALAVTVAATLAAAHTQVAFLAFTSGAIYAFMRLWRRGAAAGSTSPAANASAPNGIARAFRDAATTLVRCAPLAAAALTGLALAAAYLLPAAQLIHESAREKMTVSQANRFFADAPHLLAVLFPRFTGHPATRDFWARGNAWEPAWFVGWAPLLFAGYAAMRCLREQLVRFWLVIGMIGFWLGFGISGGLYWLAFYSVPGLGSFHDPARCLLWTTVSVSILTAVGFDAIQLRTRLHGRGPALIGLGLIAAPLIWFSTDWLPTTAPANLSLQPAGLESMRSIAGPDRIVAPANALYWKRVIGDGYIDYGSGDRRAIQRAVNTLISNIDMRNGLESASAYEPVQVGGFAAMDNMMAIALQRRDPSLTRLLEITDARLVLLPRTGMTPAPGIRAETGFPAGGTPLSAWTPTKPISRCWMTRRAERVEGRTRLVGALSSPDFDPRIVTLVSTGDSGAAPEIAALERIARHLATAGRSTYRSDRPGRAEVAADAGPSSAMLVISSTAYPGWKATVDGVPAPLYCADGLVTGVALPPGQHHVELKYLPDGLRVGGYISLMTLSTLVAAVVWRAVRRQARAGLRS